MEGVGARFGRSSMRYGGPTTVFTGPVRRWKKKWVHLPPPNSNHHHHAAGNGNLNGSNGSSHLQLYKWTPIAVSQLRDGSDNDNDGDDADPKEDDVAAEEPPKKRFKYIPTRRMNHQSRWKTEATSSPGDEKPDMNDVPMDENMDKQSNLAERQDQNESTMYLSLGLKGHDGENESDSRADKNEDD